MERVNLETQEKITERLKELIEIAGNITAFARSIGVSRDSVNNWLLGRSGIRVNDLVKISTAYHVSTDYLLGLSDTKSPDPDVKACCRYTGLSEAAIHALHNYEYEHEVIATLSKLIECRAFWPLINDISFFADAEDDLRKSVSQIEEPGNSDDFHAAISRIEDELKDYRIRRYEISESFSALIATIFQPHETIERVLDAVAVRTKPERRIPD